MKHIVVDTTARPTVAQLKPLLDMVAVELFFLCHNEQVTIRFKRLHDAHWDLENAIVAEIVEPKLVIAKDSISASNHQSKTNWKIDQYPIKS